MKNVSGMHLLLVLGLAISGIHCTEATAQTLDNVPAVAASGSGAPIAAPKLHTYFPIASMTIDENSITMGEWTTSTAVVPKAKIRVLILASWCKYCNQALDTLLKDPALRAKVDLLVFYEDELEVAVDGAVKDGTLTKEDGDRAKSGAKVTGRRIVNADAILKRKFTTHFIKTGQFKDLVSGFPTVLTCDASGCKKDSVFHNSLVH